MIFYSFLLILSESKPPPLPPIDKKSSIPPELPKNTHTLYILSNSQVKCRFSSHPSFIYLDKYGHKNTSLERKILQLIIDWNEEQYVYCRSKCEDIFVKNLERGFNTSIILNNICYIVVWVSYDKFYSF